MPEMEESVFNHAFLEKLAYETPFFVFSRQKILDKYQQFKKYFPGASVFYAMKANPEEEILKLLLDAGAGFEVASKFELDQLKKIKVPPNKIIYGTAVKPASHIKDFYEYGVRIFACDSLPELEKIAQIAPASKIYVRMSVNDTGSVYRFSSKFGTQMENVAPLLERARELGLEPFGISFHVGSQASNILAWAQAIERIQKPLEILEKVNIRLSMINLGGGFPCLYASTETELELKEIAKYTLEAYTNLRYQPQIFMEPGRGIIGETSILVTTVIERIERGGNTWLFLDAGVYNALFETMAYQGSTRYQVQTIRKSFDAGEKLFSLAGPTGDSPDIITKEIMLPADISKGDKLVFFNVGAYSISMTIPFNGFPKPPIYYV